MYQPLPAAHLTDSGYDGRISPNDVNTLKTSLSPEQKQMTVSFQSPSSPSIGDIITSESLLSYTLSPSSLSILFKVPAPSKMHVLHRMTSELTGTLLLSHFTLPRDLCYCPEYLDLYRICERQNLFQKIKKEETL